MRADPLVELADGHHQAAVLVEEGWSPGQREGVVLDADEPSGGAEKSVGQAQGERAPAGADGVQQVHHPLAR